MTNLGAMSVCPLEYRLGPSDKLVFLHIPKTAGTTLATILQNQFTVSETCPVYYSDALVDISRAEFARYRYVRGHFYFDVLQRLIPSLRATVTMLRDPVERYISDFAHFQRSEELLVLPADMIEREESRAMSLEEFVDNVNIRRNRYTRNIQSRLIGAQLEFETSEDLQAAMKTENEVRQVDMNIAKQRLDHFAVVGLAERFQESLFLLAYAFGWPPVVRYRCLQVATNRPQRERIPATTLNQIAEFNSLDFELYDHAQQAFESRFVQMTQELLEQYGTREHAHIKLPLPHETMFDLIEKHYECRYAETHTPIRALRLNFDQAMPGSGWHLAEHEAQHGAYRWSGPDTVSTLDFPLTGEGDLAVAFRVLTALSPDVLESLTLTVNDHSIPLDVYHDMAGAAIFEGRIPRQVLANGKPFARLRFHVSRTLAPCELSSDSLDDRELGLAFNWLDIFPADSLQDDSQAVQAQAVRII